MTLHEGVTALVGLVGFFGWFGVSHLTRLRGSAWLFYPLSMFFAALFFSTITGNTSATQMHRELIVDASAAAGIVYVVTLRWYWRTHEDPAKK